MLSALDAPILEPRRVTRAIRMITSLRSGDPPSGAFVRDHHPDRGGDPEAFAAGLELFQAASR